MSQFMLEEPREFRTESVITIGAAHANTISLSLDTPERPRRPIMTIGGGPA
jgi:hypothetical protein